MRARIRCEFLAAMSMVEEETIKTPILKGDVSNQSSQRKTVNINRFTVQK